MIKMKKISDHYLDNRKLHQMLHKDFYTQFHKCSLGGDHLKKVNDNLCTIKSLKWPHTDSYKCIYEC